jgi:hypothetical protein
MSEAPNEVARRGDLVVICLRLCGWKDGQRREYDDFWLGQVTSVTRAGLVRLYRPAARSPGRATRAAGPAKGSRRCSCGSSAPRSRARRRLTVTGALVTAACHVWPGHEDHVRGYATVTGVRAALRPRLPESAGWERLRDTADAWEAARREARPLLSAAVCAHGAEFRRLPAAYDAAVTAANNAYRAARAGARTGSAAA